MRFDQYRFAAFAAMLLILASTASADHLKLKSGKALEGEATAYDPATNVVTFVTRSGEVLQVKATDLDRISAYKLAKTKVKKGSAEDELRLGSFARDIELYAHAARHYDKAVKLDPGLAQQADQERVKLRAEAAGYCMRNAQEAMDKNDAKGAEKWLTTLVQKLPDEPLAAEAASMLAETYAKNHEARDDHLEQSHAKLLENELKTGKKHYDAMLANIQKGLTQTRSTGAARKEFERAFANGEKALKELDKVQKRLSKDLPEIPSLFDGYRELVREHMVESQLHLASTLTVQTSYSEALKAVNRALSVDPNNQQALAARSRIENAASRGWRW